MNRNSKPAVGNWPQSSSGQLAEQANLLAYAGEGQPVMNLVTGICAAILVVTFGLSIVDDPLPRHASVYTPVDKLKFEDPALRACVLDEAAGNAWTVSGDVTSLHCSNPGKQKVTALPGIENLVNLQYIDLSENAIADTTLLGRLRHLESLDVSRNAIAVPRLRGLQASLRSLAIDHNRVSTLDWIHEVGQLESLSIAYNRIDAIDALAALERLRILNLAHNEVADVSALAQLPHLEVLDLEANPVHDAAPLQRLGSMLFLELGDAGAEPVTVPFSMRPRIGWRAADDTTMGG